MQRVCEGTVMKLKCDKGAVINVLDASYGRQHGKEVCPAADIYTKNQNCHDVDSLPKVKAVCQGKNSCSLQSSNVQFGDPCGGTLKYLTVNYECKKAPKGRCVPVMCNSIKMITNTNIKSPNSAHQYPRYLQDFWC